jgi:hypothetical protein
MTCLTPLYKAHFKQKSDAQLLWVPSRKKRHCLEFSRRRRRLICRLLCGVTDACFRAHNVASLTLIFPPILGVTDACFAANYAASLTRVFAPTNRPLRRLFCRHLQLLFVSQHNNKKKVAKFTV